MERLSDFKAVQSVSLLASPVRTSNISERKGFSFFFLPSLALKSYRHNYKGWVRSGGTGRGQSKRSWPYPSSAEPGLQANALIPWWVQVLCAYIDEVLGTVILCTPLPPCSVPRSMSEQDVCKLSRLYTEASRPSITVDGTNGKVWVAVR